MFGSSAVERSDLLVRVEGHESVRACVPVASEHPCWNSATGCDDLPDLVDRSHSVAAWFKLCPASNPIVVFCDRKQRSFYSSTTIRSIESRINVSRLDIIVRAATVATAGCSP